MAVCTRHRPIELDQMRLHGKKLRMGLRSVDAGHLRHPRGPRHARTTAPGPAAGEAAQRRLSGSLVLHSQYSKAETPTPTFLPAATLIPPFSASRLLLSENPSRSNSCQRSCLPQSAASSWRWRRHRRRQRAAGQHSIARVGHDS